MASHPKTFYTYHAYSLVITITLIGAMELEYSHYQNPPYVVRTKSESHKFPCGLYFFVV